MHRAGFGRVADPGIDHARHGPFLQALRSGDDLREGDLVGGPEQAVAAFRAAAAVKNSCFCETLEYFGEIARRQARPLGDLRDHVVLADRKRSQAKRGTDRISRRLRQVEEP